MASNPGRGRGVEQAGIDRTLSQIGEALAGLRFGAIAITIHEGRITQIEITERRRMTL